jgi:hypothetical protein
LVGQYANLKGLTCEVQICSLLAHVFNEIEHDIRYKKLSGDISRKENKLLDALGQLTASGDVLVETIMEAQGQRKHVEQDEFQDVYDFVARMRSKFQGAANFSDNAYQLYDELLAFGLDTPDKIEKELLMDDYTEKYKDLIFGLDEICSKDVPPIVFVDAESSDCLLVLLLNKYAQQIETRHPAGRGKGRPTRIRSLATRFIQASL